MTVLAISMLIATCFNTGFGRSHSAPFAAFAPDLVESSDSVRVVAKRDVPSAVPATTVLVKN